MATESNNFVQAAIPRFDGHYDHWSMLMENFLKSKEYWSLIEKGIGAARGEGVQSAAQSAAQQKVIEEEKLKDLKVKNYLFQAIDRTIIETILNKETSKAIWDSMKLKYQGSTKVRRAQLQALRREFEVLGMKEGEKVDEYFTRTLTIANKMQVHGESMKQNVIVEKILRSMTSKFNYVVCSIEESNDSSTMSIDELQSSLLVHEQRMQGQKEEEQALNITNSEKMGRRIEYRTEGKERFRGGFRERGRGRGRQPYNKALIQCYNCQKLGHFQYECPVRNRNDRNAYFAEVDEEEEMLLMAYKDEGDHEEAKEEVVWILDSGCSNHMCSNKEWFFEFDDKFRRTVKLGDNSKMMAMGKGHIKLNIKGITQVFTEVYFIPELKNNLLSIGQLQEKQLAILIKDDKCRVYHPKKGLIMQSQMSSNRIFPILATVITPMASCLQATSEDVTNLWHCRYGHLSLKGLKTLVSMEMVKGLPALNDSLKVCQDCMKGKQHRETLPKKSLWRASKKLQLVHADICGPISPQSNSGKRYIITFIDDYSRKTWAYFLLHKSEALSIFKKYKVSVEKESGERISCLRTDRGGEFTSSEFNDFCSTHGIKRQLTTAYTPQQNGVAERKNRTIMNMVRSMLSGKELPKQFWAEAVNWSIYVINRSPTTAVPNTTPEEAWSNRKPSVECFRVFGCVAYAHIPDNQRKKLDDKSFKCVWLGVSEESKGYRLYDPVGKKIITSRDVVCVENEKWEWDRSAEELKHKELEWADINEEEDSEISGGFEGVNSHPEHADGVHNDNSSSSLVDSLPDGISQNDKQERCRRKPTWLTDYVTDEALSEGEEEGGHNLAMLISTEDPVTFEEAVKSEKWRTAMDTEIKAIEKNNTWELTVLPAEAKPIGVKWVFKTKLNEEGKVDKHKARLVAKGYSQRQGIDYNEVFAPVARWDTIRTILALAAHKGWYVYQLDVKSAFLHGELAEAIFVEQPQGFEKQGEEHKVYRLKRALYGLKQAPRAWYSRIETYFVKEGFEKCFCEHTLFTKTSDKGSMLIVSLYVDDLIFTGNSECMFKGFKDSMMREFDMSDLGRMKYFLGVEVIQNAELIFICQKKYAREVLGRFGMEHSNAVQNPIVPGCKLTKNEENAKGVNTTEYKQLVGSLLYLTATRPDLMYAVGLVSRYMERPTEMHLQAVKRILRYLRGTTEFGIIYRKGDEGKLRAYADSDYAGDVDDRKSTSGFVFMLGTGAVSWSSKKQPVVTLSTTEAEFIAAASCACQGVWLRRILGNIGLEQVTSTVIYCDNNSAIKLSKNPVLHGRSKHIDVRFHFLRDLTRDGVVELVYCNTQEQIADIMTKPLKLEAFLKLRDKLGMGMMQKLN